MISTLCLTTVADEPTFVTFLHKRAELAKKDRCSRK